MTLTDIEYKDKGIFIPPNKDGWWVSAEIMCTM
jgi:hypothetical protein